VKINYRSDIDGLRAIAVFSVIFYHLDLVLFGKNFFPGGFVGVDIFFVISGYLITSIILKEIYITKNFSFKNFYERRIRRIVPVYLISILITLPFAYILLLDGGFRDFARSVIASIFFLSNVYFWGTDNLYGGENSLLQPLLHTWSLSVEGQFYILFPFFFFIILKYFTKYFLKIILFLFIISLFLATWSANTKIILNYSLYKSFNLNFFFSSNFYLLPTRVFEFLLGSLISYFELNNYSLKERILKNFLLNQVFIFLGFCLIIFSILYFNDRMLLPSFYSLIPLVGVSFVIFFSNNKNFVTKMLSNKILVFFGLISFSLYLFHYPIFAFSRIANIFNQSIYIKILLVIFTIIISIFFYYFIERPFRNKKNISLKILITFISIFFTFLLAFSFYILKENGIKSRLPDIVLNLKYRERTLFYSKQNLQNIVLIGDSHADSLEFYLNEQLKNTNFNLLRFKTRFFLKDFNYVNKKTKTIDKELVNNNNNIDFFLKNNSNLIVILHHRWSLNLLEEYFDNQEGYTDYHKKEDRFSSYYYEPINFLTSSQYEREEYINKNLLLQIKNIIDQGHKLILIYPVPELGFNPVRLVYNSYLYNKFFGKSKIDVELLSVSYDVYKKRNEKIFKILDSIKNPNIYRIYPHNHFCEKKINRCFANNKNEIFYFDNNHLSYQGSIFVVNDILKIIDKIKSN
jgi:peptidoglycan/LPS O-acetylase OafA/YrhL